MRKQCRVPFYLQQLEKSQWFDSSKIKELQWSRLKRLLKHAYLNVPYYRKVFNDLNLTPSNIRTIEDFQKIPVLTKEKLQNNLESLKARNYKKNEFIENASGGSTGKPVIFFQHKERNERRDAAGIRQDRWAGWDIGKIRAILWGDRRDIGNANKLRKKVGDFFMNRELFLDAFNMDEKRMHEFAEQLKQFKAQVIVAYANAMFFFAKFVKKNEIKGIAPESIITSAETLSPYKREIIETVFKCPVFNRYGCREVGLIASECSEHSGLHITMENVYVEVLNGGKPVNEGQDGEIVVTDLTNYTMPFIRYNLNDIVSLSNRLCKCGRGLPLIETIEGRTSDFIRTKDGRFIHGEFFTHLFYGVKEAKQFQLIQESLNKLVIKIVTSVSTKEGWLDEIKKKIQRVMGEETKIDFQFVKNIPVKNSGKFFFTISKIK